MKVKYSEVPRSTETPQNFLSQTKYQNIRRQILHKFESFLWTVISYFIIHQSEFLKIIQKDPNRNIVFSQITILSFYLAIVLMFIGQVFVFFLDLKKFRIFSAMEMVVLFSQMFGFLSSFVAVY